MAKNSSPILQSIDQSTLTPIVRQALHRPNCQIREWHTSQLGGGAGNPVSVGLYRFEGVGQDGDEPVAWSVVLEILQSPANVGWVNMGEGDDQTHWNYWKRELLLYQSGLLESLPEGLVAPRCYGAVELPNQVAMLWLEDIHDAYAGVWSLERYALTARHLGRLNGRYLVEPVKPVFPWFGRQRSRQWVVGLSGWQTLPWDHPLVRKRYPRPEQNSFRRMLDENERFLVKLDGLPQALGHGDTYPTNFMSRHLANGLEQTVALDWALMGIEPLGDDLGQLVFGAQTNLLEIRGEDVTETLFAAYLDGLGDMGCRIEPSLVRFGFAAAAALRVGLFQIYLLGEEIARSQGGVDEAVEPGPVPDCFELVMADEAYALL